MRSPEPSRHGSRWRGAGAFCEERRFFSSAFSRLPSLRQLRARDPERLWVIRATAKYRYAIYAMHYHEQFGCRFREAKPDEEELDLLLFDLPASIKKE